MDVTEPLNLDPVIEFAAVYYSATRPKFFGRVGRHLDPESLSNGPDGFAGKGEPRKAMDAVLEAAKRNDGNGTTSVRIAAQVVREWCTDGKITIDDRIRVCGWIVEGPSDVDIDRLPAEDEVAAVLIPLLKQRAADEAIDETLNIAQSRGDLGRARDMIDDALRLGDDTGWEEADDDMIGRIRGLKSIRRLATPIVELNDRLDGGMPVGQYGLVAADSGVGKSTFLISQIACAMKQGKRCAFITNELSLEYHYARLYANLTATPFRDVLEGRDHLTLERMRILQDALKLGVLKAVRMPQGHTVADVRRWLDEKEQQMGEAFQLVAIDYPDRMSGGKDSDGEYLAGKFVTGGLRDLAEEKLYWLWGASQPRRADPKRQLIGGNDLSDSQFKMRLIHLGVSINPRNDGASLVYHVFKNTAGPDNITTSELPHDKAMARIALVEDRLWENACFMGPA